MQIFFEDIISEKNISKFQNLTLEEIKSKIDLSLFSGKNLKEATAYLNMQNNIKSELKSNNFLIVNEIIIHLLKQKKNKVFFCDIWLATRDYFQIHLNKSIVKEIINIALSKNLIYRLNSSQLEFVNAGQESFQIKKKNIFHIWCKWAKENQHILTLISLIKNFLIKVLFRE